MLFFLRKIRRKLMDSKKITSYLLYAIGEIVLVVIGILIAVSLNNWNNDLKDENTRTKYLVALEEEFLENKERLQLVRNINQRNIKAARSLSALMGEGKDIVSIDSLYQLVIGVIGFEAQYNPSTGVIDDIISSGKLELFGNDSLRYLLASWGSELSKIHFQEKEEVNTFRLNISNELLTQMSLKNATRSYQNNFFNIPESKLKTDDYQILQSVLIENLVVAFTTASEFLEMRYLSLDKKLNIIVEKIIQERQANH